MCPKNLNVQNLTIISSVDTLHYTHSQFQTATQGVAVVMYLGHETQPAPSVSCRMKIKQYSVGHYMSSEVFGVGHRGIYLRQHMATSNTPTYILTTPEVNIYIH